MPLVHVVSPWLNSVIGNMLLAPPTEHLSIRVARAKNDTASFVAHQYATYPFRLSNSLRLDPSNLDRVYAYIMNASPGVLAGDDLHLKVEVGDRAQLYLTDQSATKVYSKPAGGPLAQVSWDLKVGAGAYLEFVPEPIILFKAAAMTQTTQVTIHPTGQLVLSERIIPGRLAREGAYGFEAFHSRLRIQSPTGQLYFADNLRLLGQANRFKLSPLFSHLPLLANFIVIAPKISLERLTQRLQQFDAPADQLQVCESPLPGCDGLLVRAIASQTSLLETYQHHLLNCVRQLLNHPPLPQIPK